MRPNLDASPAAPLADPVFIALSQLLRGLCENELTGLGPDTPLDAVTGLDSLRLIEAIALLEDRFQVVVDTDRLGELHTMRDIARLIADAPGR